MLRFPQKRITRPSIHLTALIDIVFLLLVFFLLVSNFTEQQAVKIVVPDVEHESSGKLSDILITIDQDANVYYGGASAISMPLLKAGLAEELRRRGKTSIIVKADRRVSYDAVMQVIDAAKLAGATTIMLVTTRKSSS